MIYGTFLQSPLFWYLISKNMKTLFRIFKFQGPLMTQLNRGKTPLKFFIAEKTASKRNQREGHEAQDKPCGLSSLHVSPRLLLFMGSSVSQKKVTP
jgi:hypothetical protein